MKEQRQTKPTPLSPHDAAGTEATQATAPAARLPYVAPAIEVIEVRTEAGYALSGTPGPWDPTDW